MIEIYAILQFSTQAVGYRFRLIAFTTFERISTVSVKLMLLLSGDLAAINISQHFMPQTNFRRRCWHPRFRGGSHPINWLRPPAGFGEGKRKSWVMEMGGKRKGNCAENGFEKAWGGVVERRKEGDDKNMKKRGGKEGNCLIPTRLSYPTGCLKK